MLKSVNLSSAGYLSAKGAEPLAGVGGELPSCESR